MTFILYVMHQFFYDRTGKIIIKFHVTQELHKVNTDPN